MAHPRIIRSQMLDWIKNSIELGAALPTDAQIVDRFNLTGSESARSLLADLADAGEITIKGYGDARRITLGRKRELPNAHRPLPSVVKRSAGKRVDADVESTAAKIRDIIARGKKAVAPVLADPERAPLATVGAIPIAATSPAVDSVNGSEGAQVSVATTPAPHPFVGTDLPPEVIAQLSKKGQREARGEQPLLTGFQRQVAVARAYELGESTVEIADRFGISRQRVEQIARARGVPHRSPEKSPKARPALEAPHPIVGMEMPRAPKRLAIKSLPPQPNKPLNSRPLPVATRTERRQLNIHFPNDQFERLTEIANGAGTSAAAYARTTLIGCLDRKPRIPAQVAAAALRDGFPVVDFAHRMMVLGLAAYAHEMAPETVA